MRRPSFAVILVSALLLVACGRDESADPTTPSEAAPMETPASQPAPQQDPPAVLAAPPVTGEPQPPAPPSPVVEGMYVVYQCQNGTEPRITFVGNLVKVQFNANSKPIILSARASDTNMSDTYAGESLTLHREGLGITLDHGGGVTTRCTESQASA